MAPTIKKNHPLPILTIVAISLYFTGLHFQSYGIDEMASLSFTQSYDKLVYEITHYESNMWLYYLVLSLWQQVSTNEYWIRSLSAISALGSFITFYYLISRFYFKSQKYIIIASLLYLTNTLIIFYAQDARSYSMALFFSLLGTYGFHKYQQTPTKKNAALFIIAHVLAIYSHLFTVFLLAIQSSILFYQGFKKQNIKPIIYLNLIFLACIIPLIAVLQNHLEGGRIDWIAPLSLNSLIDLTIAYSSFTKPLAGIYGLLILIATYSLYKSKNYLHLQTLSFLIIPIFTVAALSIFLKPLFSYRFLIFYFPYFIILITYGLSQLRYKYLQILTLILITIFSTNRLYAYYTQPNKDDWQGVNQYISANQSPNSLVIIYPSFNRGIFTWYQPDTNTQTIAIKSLDELPTNLDQYQDIWITSAHANSAESQTIQTQMISTILKQFKQTEQKQFFNINLTHFQASEPEQTPSE